MITTLLPRCEAASTTDPRAVCPPPRGPRAAPSRGRRNCGPYEQAGPPTRRSSLVEFGLLPFDTQHDFLARRHAEVADDTLKTVEHGPIGTIRVSKTPFWMPSETRCRWWIASAIVFDARGRGEPDRVRRARRGRFPATCVVDRPNARPGRRLPPLPCLGGSNRAGPPCRRRAHPRSNPGMYPPTPRDFHEPRLVDDKLAREIHQVIKSVNVDAHRLDNPGLALLHPASRRQAPRRVPERSALLPRPALAARAPEQGGNDHRRGHG